MSLLEPLPPTSPQYHGTKPFKMSMTYHHDSVERMKPTSKFVSLKLILRPAGSCKLYFVCFCHIVHKFGTPHPVNGYLSDLFVVMRAGESTFAAWKVIDIWDPGSSISKTWPYQMGAVGIWREGMANNRNERKCAFGIVPDVFDKLQFHEKAHLCCWIKWALFVKVQHKYKLLLHNLSTCNACIDTKEAYESRTNLFLGDDIF